MHKLLELIFRVFKSFSCIDSHEIGPICLGRESDPKAGSPSCLVSGDLGITMPLLLAVAIVCAVVNSQVNESGKIFFLNDYCPLESLSSKSV